MAKKRSEMYLRWAVETYLQGDLETSEKYFDWALWEEGIEYWWSNPFSGLEYPGSYYNQGAA